jgi:Tol biopolymer transport system component
MIRYLVRGASLLTLLLLILTGFVTVTTAQDLSDNSWLIFWMATEDHGHVYRMRPDGSDLQNLTQNVTEIESLKAISPDQQWLYLEGTDQLYRMSIDGRVFQQLTNEDSDSFVTLSPDGEWLYFTRYLDQIMDAEAYRMRSDGSEIQRLGGTKGDLFYGQLFFEGAWLYLAPTSETPTLKRMRLDGSLLEDLTEGLDERGVRLKWIDFTTALSPDRQWLIFTCEAGMRTSICRMRLDGSEAQELTHLNAYNFFEAWLPNGEGMLFTSYVDSELTNGDLYQMDLDGDRKKKLTDFPDDISSLFLEFTRDQTQMLMSVETSHSGRDIYRMNLDGSSAEIIFSKDMRIYHRGTSPNEQWMLLMNIDNVHYQLEMYRVRPGENDVEKISPLPGYYSVIKWYPDGESFLYLFGEYSERDRSVYGHLYRMNIRTMEVRQLTSEPAKYVLPFYIVAGD